MYIGSLIKNFVICICSFYTLQILIRERTQSFLFQMSCVLLSIMLSIETLLIKYNFIELSYFIPALSFGIIALFLFRLPTERIFYYSIIAFTINILCFHLITGFCILPLSIIFHSLTNSLIFCTTIFVSIIYVISFIIFAKRKRIKSYASIKHSNTSINVGLICSILTLAILSFDNSEPICASNKRLLCIILIFILPFIMFRWWRSQITKSYRERKVNF